MSARRVVRSWKRGPARWLACLAIAVPAGGSPGRAADAVSFGYLAPTDHGWQVWFSRDGSPARPVTSDPADKVSLSSAAGTGEVLAVTRDGKALLLTPAGELEETIDLGAGADDAALSPDGRTIVYSREDRGAPGRPRDLWRLTRGSGPAAPLLRQGGHQRSPSLTPDGRSVAYVSESLGGVQDIWLSALDGTWQSQITVGRALHLDPSAGPDEALFVSSNRSGDYDIWRIDPSTSRSRPVVSRSGYDGEPRVSPDGRSLLFVSRAGGRGAVWLAGADGSGPRPLTDGVTEVRQPIWLGPSGSDAAPARAPAEAADEGRIAFLRLTGGVWQPWSCRPDGSDLRQAASLDADVSRLTVSRDGRWMLANGVDGRLHLIDSEAGTARLVPAEPSGTTDAALSADGRQIVYSVNTLESIDANDLWVVEVRGGNARKITHQDHLQHFPVWTPQGDIVYLSGQGKQTHDIWRVGADGANPRLIVGEHLYNFEPTVSGRGEIAFSSNQEGNYDIWLFDPSGDAVTRLTDDPAWDGQPAFSPGGGAIAFLSRRGAHAAIWILHRSSGRLSQLAIEGEVRLPIWYGTGDEAARLASLGGGAP